MGENTKSLPEDQRNLLSHLNRFAGVIWLRGDHAATALAMADTKLVALGPQTSSGAIAAAITPEGRALVPAPSARPAPLAREGSHG